MNSTGAARLRGISRSCQGGGDAAEEGRHYLGIINSYSVHEIDKKYVVPN